jgi:hypothetical protein
MKREIDSQKSKGTWTFVPKPNGTKIIERMWVMRKKTEGDSIHFKALYVAKGFRQTIGVDYTESFAPVIRMSSIRFLLSHALNHGMFVLHVDVKTAYLNSDLKETIFMHQPYLFEEGRHLVCKLDKAIYGLKQSARCWNDRLTQVLQKLGFE